MLDMSQKRINIIIYYYKLVDLCKENNSNINNFPNLTRADILDLLSKAKVFSPRPNEHFGIVTVESMVAGCLPVVHSYSGLLEVIVRNGKYGLHIRKK